VPSKIAVEYANPFVFAALRSFPAGVLLLVVAVVLKRPMSPRPLRLTALLGILQTAGFGGFTIGALVSGGAGHTAILANTWQFWILLLAWPLLGERLKGWQWLAVMLGLAGLLLIIEPWNLHGVLSSMLALTGAVSFAGGSIVAKVLRQRHEIDLLVLNGWQVLIGSIPLVLFAVFLGGSWPEWSAAFNWSLAYTLLIGTCGGAMLWLYVLKKLPASIAGLGTMGTPVVGLLASWAQLGERPTMYEVTGMISILIGLGVLFASSYRGLAPSAPERAVIEPAPATIAQTEGADSS